MSADVAGTPADPDPLTWARSWLPDDDDPVRPLMTLATVDPDGAPSARTVLLSGVGEDGFAFHTDSRSAKVSALRADPRVCLVLALPEQAHQLVVHGTASVQPAERSAAAWRRRSAYLRQLAWVNDDVLAAQPLDQRRAHWAAQLAEQPEGPIDPPPTWIGFDVVPHRYVFWQGGTDLASHRTDVTRAGTGWTVRQLAG